MRACCGCTSTKQLTPGSSKAKALTQEAGYQARCRMVERTQRGTSHFRQVLSRWDKHVGHDLACLDVACA
jgi:hypothetical protein